MSMVSWLLLCLSRPVKKGLGSVEQEQPSGGRGGNRFAMFQE